MALAVNKRFVLKYPLENCIKIYIITDVFEKRRYTIHSDKQPSSCKVTFTSNCIVFQFVLQQDKHLRSIKINGKRNSYLRLCDQVELVIIHCIVVIIWPDQVARHAILKFCPLQLTRET